MAVQQYKSSFRTTTNVGDGGPVNVLDSVGPTGGNNPGSVLWSVGAVLIDSVSLVPPFAQTWELLQVSVSALLLFNNPVFSPAFGKLGKILAGLVTGMPQTTAVPGKPYPFTYPIGPLPQDLSGIGALWDPASDQLPPTSGNTNKAGLPVTANISLPQPLAIDQAVPLGIGIWIEPSLIGASVSGQTCNYELMVQAGQYCITYDDGVTPPRPGYS